MAAALSFSTVAFGAAPAKKPSSGGPKDALVYDGTSTAYGDDESISAILDKKGITYDLVSSDDLNKMTVDDLAKYKVIVWPGGYAGQMSNSLEPATRLAIRQAVRDRGVNYVGFCAGVFIAVGPKPADGQAPDSGLALIEAPELNYFYPNGDKSLEDSLVMVDVDLPGGAKKDLVWYGGPFVSQGIGQTLAKYPDGTSAIVQAQAGQGFVILSGVHPEAPQNWRDEHSVQDTDGLDLDYAGQLIEAAKNHTPQPAF